MINAVATAPRCSAFQAQQLSDQALIVEQINFGRVQAR
jgi:hypothetical protein